MHSLFARLSIALLALVACVGGGFFVIEQWSAGQYYEELTQRLNAPIAMYVTGQASLLNNGQVNAPEMARLAEQAMVINPTAEVYLLDINGAVLGHALPPETVQLKTVDMAPVHALIDNTRAMPIRGSDPRNPARTKVFSAHPIVHEGQLQGYLYVILGGQKYDELASSLRGSYVGTVSFSAIIALVSAAFIAGLLVFSLLTRRLTRLSAAVKTFSDSNFAPQASAAIKALQRKHTNKNKADEIAQLTDAVKAMADKINEQFEGLKETDRLRRELISNVSHDLRTPLASMFGYVDTLLLKNEELSGDERGHYLNIVRNHTRRLESLIGDLFQLSKLEADSMHLSLEAFPLAELLQDVCQEFELEAAQRNIAIDIEHSAINIMVYADIALVQRVLENLLRNALNFTAQGGSIALSLKTHGDCVAVSIADTGCGIPDEKLVSIFERFYTAGSAPPLASQSDHNATGLGLAIVKRILDLHGCRISVSSVVDEGTCFEFDLPTVRTTVQATSEATQAA